MRRRQEVDNEAPYEEDVEERYNPFKDGGDIVAAFVLCYAEGDREGRFDDDEGEFEPEGGAQDAVFAEVDAEALVFGADEDCGYYVAATRFRVSNRNVYWLDAVKLT